MPKLTRNGLSAVKSSMDTLRGVRIRIAGVRSYNAAMTETAQPISHGVAGDALHALLNAAVDAVVLIDVRGNITHFNLAAQRLFGYAEADVVGRNVSVLMPKSYAREHDGYIARYARTREAHIIGIGREVEAQRKDGSTFPIELSVGEFCHEGDAGYVGILRDITARKRQEEALRRSSEELSLIFDSAPTAITITDLHGHILNANRAACELLEYGPLDLRSLRHSDLLYAEDRAYALQRFAELRETGKPLQCDLRYVAKTGHIVHTAHHAGVIHDERGEPMLLVVEIVDRSMIYELSREAEELRGRLAHVGRVGLLGEMVSGIAHEVNQPLTAIANYASAARRMLAADQLEGPQAQEILAKISAQAERAGQVIHSLRALVKREAAHHARVDCNQLVTEVMRLVEYELHMAGFSSQVMLDPDLPGVIGDGVQIQQVILNLVHNAIEAMRDSGQGDEVEVQTLVPESDWVEIRVTDHGPGVPPAVARRLFEPFFTTKAQGMGLGLSICKSIASAHKGELSYFVNEHQGATFALRLPVGEEGSGG